ncbi:MAG: hypothetical protein ACRDZQ_05670, partial [Acidimicrobiales bacterium]
DARRPDLCPTALTSVLATARPGWWRRWPPLPVPAEAWLGFRLECATGRRDGPVRGGDVVSWLEWCRSRPGRPR